MKHRDPDFTDANDAQFDVLFTVEGYRESGLLLRYDSNISLYYRGRCTRNLVYAAFSFVMAAVCMFITYDLLTNTEEHYFSWSYVVPLLLAVFAVLATIVFVGTAAQYDMIADFFQPNKKHPSGPFHNHLVKISSHEYRF